MIWKERPSLPQKISVYQSDLQAVLQLAWTTCWVKVLIKRKYDPTCNIPHTYSLGQLLIDFLDAIDRRNILSRISYSETLLVIEIALLTNLLPVCSNKIKWIFLRLSKKWQQIFYLNNWNVHKLHVGTYLSDGSSNYAFNKNKLDK